MISGVVVFDSRVTRDVSEDTHQWLLGSCVKLRLRSWCWKIHSETEKQSHK